MGLHSNIKRGEELFDVRFTTGKEALAGRKKKTTYVPSLRRRACFVRQQGPYIIEYALVVRHTLAVKLKEISYV